jgi:hypothetical protein
MNSKSRKLHLLALREIQTFVNLVVAGTVVAATELTIEWNGIEGVGDLNSAGQLIPMLISLGLVTRVMYIKITKISDYDDSDDSDAGSSSDDWPGRVASEDGRSYVEPPPTSRSPYRFEQNWNTLSPELSSLSTLRPTRARR